MLIIVYLLSVHDILNFKYFFVSAALSSVFISFDIIFQYIFGFNIIGLKSLPHVPGSYFFRNASFFGDELIAGGFIKNFSFFSIFFVAFIFKNKNNIRFLLIMLTICIVGMGILSSGNRMPLILFVFGLLLIFLLNNKLKKVLSVSLIVLFIIFGLIGSFDKNIKDNFYFFYRYSKYIIINLPNTSESKKFDFILTLKDGMVKHDTLKEDGLLRHDFDSFWPTNTETGWYGHSKLFNTAIDLWQKNKIFGGGIKSFRVKCAKIVEHTRNRLCSTHPHNYYLEILTDTGIAGFLIVGTIALIFVVFIIKNFKFFSGNGMGNYILLATVISLILETFPLKSTGSIFTTNNATYLILISSIILSYKKLLTVQNSDNHI